MVYTLEIKCSRVLFFIATSVLLKNTLITFCSLNVLINHQN